MKSMINLIRWLEFRQRSEKQPTKIKSYSAFNNASEFREIMTKTYKKTIFGTSESFGAHLKKLRTQFKNALYSSKHAINSLEQNAQMNFQKSSKENQEKEKAKVVREAANLNQHLPPSLTVKVFWYFTGQWSKTITCCNSKKSTLSSGNNKTHP